MFRRLLLSFLALLSAVPLTVLGSAASARAADGLSYRSTTTYTVDAQSGVVRVLVDISLSNTIPDQREGNYINRRYFTGFSLPAPAGAGNGVATTANGRALGLTSRLIAGNADFFLYDIDLASNLYYGQRANVLISYEIAGLPPRSENPSRVNAAYAAFDAFGIGDDGKVTVRVVVPTGFEIDTFGDDATLTVENGSTVYTATDIPNPEEFNIFVSARNDAGLTETAVTTPDGDQFNLRTWPGDTEWQAFVTTQIEDGVPVLGELIGRPWPIDEKVEVREAYTPYLYGYAGWFNSSSNEIEIGEELDQEVVLHELSHAWFNSGWFPDRWLNEGFAQLYSNKAVEQMGGEALQPEPISATDPGNVTLNEWDDPNFVDGADEIEDYGYNASYSVVQQIADEIGDDKMRQVLTAVDDQTIAYRGEVAAEEHEGTTDWRRFLDLVVEVGGSATAEGLIDQYVASESQQVSLEARAQARESYSKLTEHGDEWAAPYVVRERMSSWSFTRAEESIDEAQAVLTLRDELDQRAAELGSTYPDDLQATYEAVDTSFGDATAAVQQQLETAESVLAAIATEGADDGLFDKFGLLGTNLPELLAEAKAAFADGNHDLARGKAQEVIDTVDNAPDVGKGRALWLAGAVLAFLLLVVGLVVLLRRRTRRKVAVTEAATAAAAAAATGEIEVDESTADESTADEPLAEEPLAGEHDSDTPDA